MFAALQQLSASWVDGAAGNEAPYESTCEESPVGPSDFIVSAASCPCVSTMLDSDKFDDWLMTDSFELSQPCRHRAHSHLLCQIPDCLRPNPKPATEKPRGRGQIREDQRSDAAINVIILYLNGSDLTEA
eukprot:scaffold139804_cov33-Prasinocladus_malaysianus.AAC.2